MRLKTLAASLIGLLAASGVLAQSERALTSAERQEIEAQIARGGVDTDAAMYARDFGVSLTEAKRRMAIQNRDAVGPQQEPGPPPQLPPDSVGRIGQLIEQNEAATFAGMWWQHQPEYRMIVAFTRDPEATLRRYTTDPLFEARLAKGPTQAELRATQDRLMRELNALGARVSWSSSDIMKGRVEIGVTGDLGPVRAAAAAGRLDLPAYVDLIEPAPLKAPAPPPPAAGASPLVKAFPQLKHRSGGIELSSLSVATVVLDDGCLRFSPPRPGRKGAVVVWKNEAALDLSSEPGAVRVLDRSTGKSIRIGEKVAFTGPFSELGKHHQLKAPTPACPGPYLVAGSFQSYDEFNAPILKREAEELARGERISVAEATRRLTEKAAREERLHALGHRLERDAPSVYAGMVVYDGQARILFTRDPEGEIARLVEPELRPHLKPELGLRPLAELKAIEAKLTDDLEAIGFKGGASVDFEAGRVSLSTEDLAGLNAAVAARRIAVPDDVQIVTSGASEAGTFSDANHQAALRRFEAMPHFAAAVRQLVAETRLPSENGPEATLSRAGSLETAQFLVAHGFTPDLIQRARAGGFDPVRAWRARNGMGTVEGRAVLAEQVIVGEVLSLDPNGVALGDGGRTTARFRVLETLKGDLAPGAVANVRMNSGAEPDGRIVQENGEPMVLPNLPGALRPGERWLLFLSSGMYAHQAHVVGGRPASPPGERWFRAVREMAPVRGENIGPTYTEPALGSLTSLRARLAPIAAAFRR